MSHDVWQMGFVGVRTTPWMCMLCGNIFGNAEAETSLIAFSQEDIDITLYFCDEFLKPKSWAAPYAINKNVPKCILRLCISDTNKELLMRSVPWNNSSDYVSPAKTVSSTCSF